MALGNDGGYLRGLKIGMPLKELLAMQDAGLTPMQVIVASTYNAAEVCQLKDSLGTLEVGKIADVLAIEGDPLQDLQVLENVRLVMHKGVIIRDERATSRQNSELSRRKPHTLITNRRLLQIDYILDFTSTLSATITLHFHKHGAPRPKTMLRTSKS